MIPQHENKKKKNTMRVSLTFALIPTSVFKILSPNSASMLPARFSARREKENPQNVIIHVSM